MAAVVTHRHVLITICEIFAVVDHFLYIDRLVEFFHRKIVYTRFILTLRSKKYGSLKAFHKYIFHEQKTGYEQPQVYLNAEQFYVC